MQAPTWLETRDAGCSQGLRPLRRSAAGAGSIDKAYENGPRPGLLFWITLVRENQRWSGDDNTAIGLLFDVGSSRFFDMFGGIADHGESACVGTAGQSVSTRVAIISIEIPPPWRLMAHAGDAAGFIDPMLSAVARF